LRLKAPAASAIGALTLSMLCFFIRRWVALIIINFKNLVASFDFKGVFASFTDTIQAEYLLRSFWKFQKPFIYDTQIFK
jgi:hypothetical protein